jgi:hypothetical protein
VVVEGVEGVKAVVAVEGVKVVAAVTAEKVEDHLEGKEARLRAL